MRMVCRLMAPACAVWMRKNGRLLQNGRDFAVTDSAGRFVVAGVPVDAQLGVTAWTDQRATVSLVNLAPKQREFLRIVLRSDAVVTIEGRVVDQASKPVGAAQITVRRRYSGLAPIAKGMGGQLALGGEELLTTIKTNDEGVFRLPAKVTRSEKYSIVVRRQGW